MPVRDGSPDPDVAWPVLWSLLQQPWAAVAPPVSARGEDLGRALEIGVRLGVGPLVAKRVLASCGTDSSLFARAFEIRGASVVRHRAALARLAEVAAALRSAGVFAIAIKGPVFAATVYDDPTTRTSGDLDVYVPPLRLAAALRALEAVGYAARDSDRRFVHALGTINLAASTKLWPLDLHVSLAKPYLITRPPAPRERDTVELDLGGARIAMLDPAWTLALAAVHLHQDLFSLRRIVDLAACLAKLPRAAIGRAFDLARRFRVAGMLKLGAAVARRLGAPRHAALEGAPPSLLQRAFSKRLALADVSLPPPRLRLEGRSTFSQMAARWLLLDGVADVATSAARRVFPPRVYVDMQGGSLRRVLRIAGKLARGGWRD